MGETGETINETECEMSLHLLLATLFKLIDFIYD